MAEIARRLVLLVALMAALAVIGTAIGLDPLRMPWTLFYLVVVASLPLLLALLVIVALPMVPLRRRDHLLAPLCVAVTISALVTFWPLRLTFLLHRPWLEPIADRMKVGEVNDGRVRVGIFRFNCVYLHSTGNVGFHLSGGRGGGLILVRQEPGSTRLWYNSDTLANLGYRWHLVHED